MKRTRLAILAVAVSGLALAVPALASAPRSGTLHVTKNCDDYTAEAGSFCTITSSNLHAIPAGSKVVYASGADFNTGILDSDITVYTRGANAAYGHVVLDLNTGTGTVSLSGGTGQFKSLSASVDVSYLGGADFGWDGGYSY
jgi:hypothetical protein